MDWARVDGPCHVMPYRRGDGGRGERSGGFAQERDSEPGPRGRGRYDVSMMPRQASAPQWQGVRSPFFEKL